MRHFLSFDGGYGKIFTMVISLFKPLFYFIFIAFMMFVSWGGFGVTNAQEVFDVRAGNHNGYSRLVFDWKSSTGYDVKKDNDALIVSFDKVAQPNIGAINNIKNIGGVKLLTSSGQLPEFSISVAPESKFRHFKIGNRVIVDVYDSNGTPTPIVSTITPTQPQARSVEKTEQSNEVTASNGISAQGEFSRNPHVITISSTKNVGLAVFERAGY
jgi:hypothetical protein